MFSGFAWRRRPLHRTAIQLLIGGCESFIVHTGDTESLWIYYGRETMLYMRDPNSHKLEKKYVLASGHAGEGPWYETDSWITDVDKDGDMDILSRDIGQWMAEDSTGEFEMNFQDDLRAVTWNDTGFVELQLRNPDSLKGIYRNYYYSHY